MGDAHFRKIGDGGYPLKESSVLTHFQTVLWSFRLILLELVTFLPSLFSTFFSDLLFFFWGGGGVRHLAPPAYAPGPPLSLIQRDFLSVIIIITSRQSVNGKGTKLESEYPTGISDKKPRPKT